MSWYRYWFVGLIGIATAGLFLPEPAMGGPAYRSPMRQVSPTSSRTASSRAVLPSMRSTTTVVFTITLSGSQPQARPKYVAIWGPDGTMKTFQLEGGGPEIQIRLTVVPWAAMAWRH